VEIEGWQNGRTAGRQTTLTFLISSIDFSYVEILRLAPIRFVHTSCTLNIEFQTVLYVIQQRPLNGSLNL
jgi:hypothetical protein